jgi:hypothetical protein
MTPERIIELLENCQPLLLSLQTEESRLPVAQYIARVSPGSVVPILKAPGFSNRDPLTKTSNVLSLAGNASRIFQKRDEENAAAAPMNPGKKFILEALKEGNMPASCYNMRALARTEAFLDVVDIGDSFDSRFLFMYNIGDLLVRFRKCMLAVKSLMKVAREEGAIGRTEKSESFRQRKDPSAKEQVTVVVRISRLTHKLTLSDVGAYKSERLKASEGNLLAFLPYTRMLYPINAQEIEEKGQLVSEVTNFIKSLTLSSADAARMNLSSNFVLRSLSSAAISNLGVLTSLHKDTFKQEPIDSWIDKVPGSNSVLQIPERVDLDNDRFDNEENTYDFGLDDLVIDPEIDPGKEKLIEAIIETSEVSGTFTKSEISDTMALLKKSGYKIKPHTGGLGVVNDVLSETQSQPRGLFHFVNGSFKHGAGKKGVDTYIFRTKDGRSWVNHLTKL